MHVKKIETNWEEWLALHNTCSLYIILHILHGASQLDIGAPTTIMEGGEIGGEGAIEEGRVKKKTRMV